MRIVVAPDSFKECLSARAVAEAICVGVRRAAPGVEVVAVPMADGGEGTVDALVSSTGGRYETARVCGPLGDAVEARYGFLGDGSTAVIEMAAASGLPLVPVARRDPGVTTTYGTGELILDAVALGARRIIVGLGGSATNDGGAGMAQALGYSLLDGDGRELSRGGLALAELARIGTDEVRAELEGVSVLAACDVDNPLCGPKGSSRVYGPQKGADAALVEKLDEALAHFCDVIARDVGRDVRDVPGSGAAGGLAAGLLVFMDGELQPGVELVAEACGLEAQIADAALVFTGEGRLDDQSVRGKTPVGVARIALRHGVPVVALAGELGKGYEAVLEHGVTAAYSINEGLNDEGAMGQAAERLSDAAERAMRRHLDTKGVTS